MDTIIPALNAEELMADSLTAYIATWSEQKLEAAFESPTFAGGYAIWLVGQGQRSQHWGAGYAMWDDALRAFAVQRVLHLRPSANGIIVHVKGLMDQIRFPDGHVRAARKRPENRKASGEEFDLFPVFDEITSAMDAGRWTPMPIVKRKEPDGYWIAEELAATTARESAERHRPMFAQLSEIYPRNLIIATDEDPDPYGLFKAVAA